MGFGGEKGSKEQQPYALFTRMSSLPSTIFST